MNIGVTKTPIGQLAIVEHDGAIVKLQWGGENQGIRTDIIKEGLRQLEAFFAGERTWFDLPLKPEGSMFQQLVWGEMCRIPMGETRTYGDVAKKLDGASQAVGAACGANPIPILIPCHRIIGADGLGGYSGDGGIETKIWLLKFEGAASLLI